MAGTPEPVTLTRPVTRAECPWLDRDYPAGQVLWTWTGHRYGVVGDGIALTEEPGRLPFFEIPAAAIIGPGAGEAAVSGREDALDVADALGDLPAVAADYQALTGKPFPPRPAAVIDPADDPPSGTIDAADECVSRSRDAVYESWSPAAVDAAAGLIAEVARAWAGHDPRLLAAAEAILASSPVLG